MNVISKWFPKKDLFFSYDDSKDFYLSQWQADDTIKLSYIVYRLCNLSYFYTIVYFTERITSNLSWTIKIHIFLYYTYWSFMLSSMTSFMYLLVTIMHLFKKNPISKMIKVTFFLSALSFDSTLSACIGYWTFVYWYQGETLRIVSCIMHLWNPIMLLMDFVIVRVPARFAHVIYSLSLMVVYVVFTLVYYLCGGRNVTGKHYLYKMMDYQKPSILMGGMVLMAIYIVLVRFISVGLYRLRIVVFTKVFARRHV